MKIPLQTGPGANHESQIMRAHKRPILVKTLRPPLRGISSSGLLAIDIVLQVGKRVVLELKHMREIWFVSRKAKKAQLSLKFLSTLHNQVE
jgi:hypothetical protein